MLDAVVEYLTSRSTFSRCMAWIPTIRRRTWSARQRQRAIFGEGSSIMRTDPYRGRSAGVLPPVLLGPKMMNAGESG